MGAKFNEPDENLPKLREIRAVVKGDHLTWYQIVKCEENALIKMNWDVNVQTPL